MNSDIENEHWRKPVHRTFEYEGLMNWYEAMLIIKSGGRVRSAIWHDPYRYLTVLDIVLPSQCAVRKVIDVHCNPGELHKISIYDDEYWVGVRCWQRVFDVDETDIIKAERQSPIPKDEKNRIEDMLERTLKFANATRKE